MAIDALPDGATILVLAEHRLDSSNAGAFQEELELVTEAASPAVVIDMNGLDYISSAGLRAIMQAVRKMQHQGAAWPYAPCPAMCAPCSRPAVSTNSSKSMPRGRRRSPP